MVPPSPQISNIGAPSKARSTFFGREQGELVRPSGRAKKMAHAVRAPILLIWPPPFGISVANQVIVAR